MELIVITVERLQDLLDSHIQKIECIIKDSQKKEITSKEWLNSKEVCDLLKISMTTLHDWSKKGLLKKHKISSRIRFRRDQVLERLHIIESKNNFVTVKRI